VVGYQQGRALLFFRKTKKWLQDDDMILCVNEDLIFFSRDARWPTELLAILLSLLLSLSPISFGHAIATLTD
jgi:hypothetical protein